MNKPFATTFKDGQAINVVILSKPSTTGLVKVESLYGAKIFVRHKDRLNPLNQEAIDILNGNQNK